MNGYNLVGGVDGGECDAPFKFGTFPSDVDNFKARLHTIFEATDIGVNSCVSLSRDEKKSWSLFISEWRTFFSQKTPLFGTYNKWVTTCTYAHTLDAWIEKLNKTNCKLPGPENIKGANTEIVKWGVAAVVGIGAVVLFTIYAPEIKAVFRKRK